MLYSRVTEIVKICKIYRNIICKKHNLVLLTAAVDLIRIPRLEFDDVLRSSLKKEWDILQDALIHFNYFKCWDEEAIRECCILSKLKDFQPDEV